MKNIMIALLVLCFTATVGNTNENNIINKVTTHISNEKQEIIELSKEKLGRGQRFKLLII